MFRLLKDSNILSKGVTKTIENKTKEQKVRFWSMLLGTLGAKLVGNMIAGKGRVRAGSENKRGKGIVRAGNGKEWDFWCHFVLSEALKYKILWKWT